MVFIGNHQQPQQTMLSFITDFSQLKLWNSEAINCFSQLMLWSPAINSIPYLPSWYLHEGVSRVSPKTSKVPHCADVLGIRRWKINLANTLNQGFKQNQTNFGIIRESMFFKRLSVFGAKLYDTLGLRVWNCLLKTSTMTIS